MSVRISSRWAALAGSAVLAGAGLLVGVTPAFAGAGLITMTVTPLSPNVTYSANTSNAALVAYVGYTVTVASDMSNTNTINNIRFTGGTSVTDSAETATFSSAEGATCTTTNAALTSIECTIGQLRAGESFPTFAVFFKAPIKITNGVADDVLPDFVKDFVNFSGVTYYAEGTGGPNSVPQNSTKTWAALAVTLGTSNPTLVKSAVPKSGGNFFTGNGGVSTGADPFATFVNVPPAAKYTMAEIAESTFTANCTNFNTCYRSDITIPVPDGAISFAPYLTIVLRQDALNIKPGTRIESVLVHYVDELSVVHIVGDCANPTTPRSDYLPCIAKRVYYKNSRVPGWTAELDRDFEWTIINLKNGGYTIE